MHKNNKQPKRRRAIIFKAILALPFVFVFVVVLLVRFTDGAISSNGKIILGYDEANGRFQVFENRVYNFNGPDGPYLYNQSTVYTVNENNEFEVSKYAGEATLTVKVHDASKTQFVVPLVTAAGADSTGGETAIFPLPDQLIAISDMEGNFEVFTDFLMKHGVIDEALTWTFESNSLVLVGDFVDRGHNVTQVLWLIYKLEQEARTAGGRVHFLLGNHEVMNIQGDLRYAEDKYVRIAEEIATRENFTSSKTALFHANSVLGAWLRGKNTVVKIGNYLFLHGGLSPALVAQNLPLDVINASIRANLDADLDREPGELAIDNLLAGREGPLWYRGLVMDYKEYYTRASPEHVDAALSLYDADHIVIGHTVVDAVSADFDGRIIRIDVKHGKEKDSPRTQGLLVEDGVPYHITGQGTKEKL